LPRDRWTGEAANTWSKGGSAPRDIRLAEKPLERAVSQHIRSMPFLWVKINDEPGPNSHRGLIERNAIALLSNYNSISQPIDPPSDDWLGSWAYREYIQRSGLWNVNHVTENYNRNFLDLLEQYASS